MEDRRPVCSYGTACFRRNPYHFRQLTHPHLNKVLSTISPDMPLTIPEKMDYVCTDKALLIDQLQILREINNGQILSPPAERIVPSSPVVSSPASQASKSGTRVSPPFVKRIVPSSPVTSGSASGAPKRNREESPEVEIIEVIEPATLVVPAKRERRNSTEIEKNSSSAVAKSSLTFRSRVSLPSCSPVPVRSPVPSCSPMSLSPIPSCSPLQSHSPVTSSSSTTPSPQPSSSYDSQADNLRQQEILRLIRECGEEPPYVPKRGKFAMKLARFDHYKIFFTAVQSAPKTWKQKISVTFSELLDKSLGEITSSLHLNFVINIGWICSEYLLAGQKPNLLIYYGEREDKTLDKNGKEVPLPDNIKAHRIVCPSSYGCHHSKISMLQYQNGGIRVIVSTANLYKDDWAYRTQGLWMSPHLPRLPNSAKASDGESRTGFKKDLLDYLSQYDRSINHWKSIVARADFSSVNVFFVASVPGNYRGQSDQSKWGHKRLASILKSHVEIPTEEKSTIVAQASSIGSLGPDYDSWITTDIINSMSKAQNNGKTKPEFKFIFPTIEDFKNSFDMREARCALTYRIQNHSKQSWIKRYMHRWTASRSYRNEAMPHIKSFTRLSTDDSKIWWFVLGSGNLSKAAWGYSQGSVYKILNYEACVVFIPKFFHDSETFPVKLSDDETTPIFPIPYDIPLTPYRSSDEPFVSEFLS